jgi:hypothetical protein
VRRVAASLAAADSDLQLARADEETDGGAVRRMRLREGGWVGAKLLAA